MYAQLQPHSQHSQVILGLHCFLEIQFLLQGILLVSRTCRAREVNGTGPCGNIGFHCFCYVTPHWTRLCGTSEKVLLCAVQLRSVSFFGFLVFGISKRKPNTFHLQLGNRIHSPPWPLSTSLRETRSWTVSCSMLQRATGTTLMT